MVEFINIEVQRYAPTKGDVEKLKLRVNVNSISYVEEMGEHTALFRIIGDNSVYKVIDDVSYHKLEAATHE